MTAFQSNAFQGNAFQIGRIASATAIFVITTGFVFARPLYYQSTAFVPTPPVTPDNNQTIDKWLVPLSTAVPIPRAPQYYHLFVPKTATVENTTNVLWPLTQGEVARPIMRAAPQGYHLFVPKEATVENTINRLWPLTQGEVARPIPRPAPQGHHLFVPKTATVENTTNTVWPLAFGEKARPIPQVAPQGYVAFGTPPPPIVVSFSFTVSQAYPSVSTLNYNEWAWTVTSPPTADNNQDISKWQQPLSRAVPIPQASPAGGSPFIPRTATIDNTTNVVWPLTFGELARPIPRAAPQGYHLFVPRTATVDNTTNVLWPLTQGEIARPIQRPAPVGGQPFLPEVATVENTTNVLWPLTFGEIARPIPRVAPQGAWVFGFPYTAADNNVTPDKWLIRWDLPPRYLLPLQSGSPFIPRTATVDNTTTRLWPLVFGEKAVPIPRVAPQGYHLFVPKEATRENTQTPDKWLNPFGVPPRYLLTLPGGQPFIPRAAVLENTVTPDKWLIRWGNPPLYWQRIQPGSLWVPFAPVQVDNTVTPDKWLRRLDSAIPYPLLLPGGVTYVPLFFAPPTPPIPPPPNKAMTTRFVASVGFGRDTIRSGRGFSQTRGGKGKSRTEHDP